MWRMNIGMWVLFLNVTKREFPLESWWTLCIRDFKYLAEIACILYLHLITISVLGQCSKRCHSTCWPCSSISSFLCWRSWMQLTIYPILSSFPMLPRCACASFSKRQWKVCIVMAWYSTIHITNVKIVVTHHHHFCSTFKNINDIIRESSLHLIHDGIEVFMLEFLIVSFHIALYNGKKVFQVLRRVLFHFDP